MRLWHKDLLERLPRQQLLGQWRECCAIARNIKERGTPNHLLVNKIMKYPMTHFTSYCRYVCGAMDKRGYKADIGKIQKYMTKKTQWNQLIPIEKLYPTWHNTDYLIICMCNLEEKYLCGGITREEWENLKPAFERSVQKC